MSAHTIAENATLEVALARLFEPTGVKLEKGTRIDVVDPVQVGDGYYGGGFAIRVGGNDAPTPPKEEVYYLRFADETLDPRKGIAAIQQALGSVDLIQKHFHGLQEKKNQKFSQLLDGFTKDFPNVLQPNDQALLKGWAAHEDKEWGDLQLQTSTDSSLVFGRSYDKIADANTAKASLESRAPAILERIKQDALASGQLSEPEKAELAQLQVRISESANGNWSRVEMEIGVPSTEKDDKGVLKFKPSAALNKLLINPDEKMAKEWNTKLLHYAVYEGAKWPEGFGVLAGTQQVRSLLADRGKQLPEGDAKNAVREMLKENLFMTSEEREEHNKHNQPHATICPPSEEDIIKGKQNYRVRLTLPDGVTPQQLETAIIGAAFNTQQQASGQQPANDTGTPAAPPHPVLGQHTAQVVGAAQATPEIKGDATQRLADQTANNNVQGLGAA